MDWLGIEWLGVGGDNTHRVLVTPLLLGVVLTVALLSRGTLRALLPNDRFSRARFWIQQIISLAAAGALILGPLSIWLRRPEELAATLSLFTAGLAFALQRVITSVAPTS
jgi:hypothetical protein